MFCGVCVFLRLELENRVADLEQQRTLQEAAEISQKEQWEERFRAAQLGEETARKEASSLKYQGLPSATSPSFCDCSHWAPM